MAVQDLIVAANGGVPAGTYKPHNCHEAVLGWVLQGKYPTLRQPDQFGANVERAWVTLRSITERYGVGAPKQLSGPWVGTRLYRRNVARVRPQTFDMIGLGDIVFMGDPAAPHHSMVIVQKNATDAFARGFNNAGAFGGAQNVIFGPGAPFMGFDVNLRQITKMAYWNQDTGKFRAVNGECLIHRIPFDTLAGIIPDNMNFP
jgi:hypothetical protein